MVNLENMSDKQGSLATDNRSSSPNSSPRSSPKPSPRPQTKREHSRTDSHLTVNYKEPSPTPSKYDLSNISQDSSTSRSSNNTDAPSADSGRFENTISKERKESKTSEKAKKKSSWYNVLYPSYKSRSEDFKRIFKDVPDDERLVVDYSCALQKEILVHGRLYVSQNFLCFYANIFRWETNVTFKWKDVTAITKEKTALVIPNAVLICTRNEKFFFTSFGARDKTYLMLFRVWQNALLEQPMSMQEMWQWVHQCYGDELGLTSEDEDYIPPGTEEDKLSARLSVESFSEECASIGEGTVMENILAENKLDEESQLLTETNITPETHIPTDLSDSTESDVEKTKFECHPSCTASHEGRQLVSEIIPMHVDQLFTLLFTSSKFFLDFHASRKTSDLIQSAWSHNSSNNTKSRVVNLTVNLNHAVGPKTAQVTETQEMLPCSKAGFLYSINIESVNAGVPYADSFYVAAHYCLQRISDTQCSLAIYAQIKYKKSVWGLVRGFIEKNCWQGLEDFYTSLAKSILMECDEIIGPTIKRKSRRRRRGISNHRPESMNPHPKLGASTKISSSGGVFNSDLATVIVFAVLIILVVLNVMLYCKLWTLEETPPYTLLDLHVLQNPPQTQDEWIKLLQQQETLHTVEMQKWQKVLKTAIHLLKQIEESLTDLQHSIHPTYTNKIMSIIQSHKDVIEKAQEL